MRTLESVLVVMLLLAPALRGEPWMRHTIDDESRGADGVRLADINGDMRLDIATGWEEGGIIRAYLQPPPNRVREKWPALDVGQVKSPEDAVFADLDSDGAVDVVSCCEGKTRSVFFHWSPKNAAQGASSDWATNEVPSTNGQMWMFAVPVQLDGRHGVDLIVGSKEENASISWLQSPADPRDVDQWKLHPLRPAGWIMSLELHDMDADGDLDLIFSDRKGDRRGVAWLENPGAAAVRSNASWREHSIGGTDHQVMFLSVFPSMKSGSMSIAAATSGGPLLLFERSASHEAWSSNEIPLPSGCGTGKSVAAGDINLDGQLDLVFSCENARGELSGVRWLSKTPAGWQDHEISGRAGVKFDRVEILDLDNDGDLDVLTCEERDNFGVIWYENPAR